MIGFKAWSCLDTLARSGDNSVAQSRDKATSRSILAGTMSDVTKLHSNSPEKAKRQQRTAKSWLCSALSAAFPQTTASSAVLPNGVDASKLLRLRASRNGVRRKREASLELQVSMRFSIIKNLIDSPCHTNKTTPGTAASLCPGPRVLETRATCQVCHVTYCLSLTQLSDSRSQRPNNFACFVFLLCQQRHFYGKLLGGCACLTA